MGGRQLEVIDKEVARAADMTASTRPILSCRLMTDDDIGEGIGLLSRGFPERGATYWRVALARLHKRNVPEGRPRYGYVMIDRGQFVGIVLVIFAETDDGGVRGNVSSWYVDPAYRGFSHILLAAPLRDKSTTLFNVSPAPNTFQTIEAQGFCPYINGQFITFAALCPSVSDATVTRIVNDAGSERILADHASWGCLSFETSVGAQTYPFVFVKTRLLGGRLPCVQLVYCHDIGDFVRFAGPLCRRLLRHGIWAVVVDVDRPLRGLPGTFRAGRGPKYYRGPAAPRLGDLSYTELAIFGA